MPGTLGAAADGPATASHTRRCSSTFSARSVGTSRIVAASEASAPSSAARKDSGVLDAHVAEAVERGGVRRSRGRGGWRRARSKSAPSRSTGRKWKMPPPSLLSRTITSGRPSRRAASSPPMSWASATSPISSTVGPRAGGGDAERGRDGAVDPVGAAVGEHARGAYRGRGKNVSTSRTGIEDATTSVALRRQPHAELGGHARLGQLAEQSRDRVGGGAVGAAPGVEPVRGPCAAASAPAPAGRR